MALFSIVWKTISQITHLSICDGIDDIQIYMYMNKSMTIAYCLSQNNFRGGMFCLVHRLPVGQSVCRCSVLYFLKKLSFGKITHLKIIPFTCKTLDYCLLNSHTSHEITRECIFPFTSLLIVTEFCVLIPY